jgi:hypothetical protein
MRHRNGQYAFQFPGSRMADTDVDETGRRNRLHTSRLGRRMMSYSTEGTCLPAHEELVVRQGKAMD